MQFTLKTVNEMFMYFSLKTLKITHPHNSSTVNMFLSNDRFVLQIEMEKFRK